MILPVEESKAFFHVAREPEGPYLILKILPLVPGSPGDAVSVGT